MVGAGVTVVSGGGVVAGGSVVGRGRSVVVGGRVVLVGRDRVVRVVALGSAAGSSGVAVMVEMGARREGWSAATRQVGEGGMTMAGVVVPLVEVAGAACRSAFRGGGGT